MKKRLLTPDGVLQASINVIDTALNYRGQRSERAVGTALRRLTASGDVSLPGGQAPADGGLLFGARS